MGRPEAPPNLRYSDSDQDCAGCRAFKSESQTCSMFSDWPVGPDLVCDDWDPKTSEPIRDNGSAS